MPYGVYRFNQLIDESYIITKVTNNSWNDVMEMSLKEEQRILEIIEEENKREQERIDKLNRKAKH